MNNTRIIVSKQNNLRATVKKHTILAEVKGATVVTGITYLVPSVSANWNDAYASILANSGNWNSAYLTVGASSGDWYDTRSSVADSSASWESAYLTLKETSASWVDSRNTLWSSSGLWNDTRSAVSDASGEWNSAFTSLGSGSGKWESAFSTINMTSGLWNDTRSAVVGSSGAWNSVFATVVATSASWNGGNSAFKTLGANSGLWGGVYTTVVVNSADWESGYSTLGSSSAQWNSASTTVETNSAKWNDTRSSLGANSGYWQSTYGTVGSMSASWSGGGSASQTLGANSGKWESVFSTVGSNSGLWNDTRSAVAVSSGNWNSAHNTLLATSASWAGGKSAYDTLGANSGLWNDTRSAVAGASGQWDSVYTTVHAMSASWDESADVDALRNDIGAVSGNWNSSFATLGANSGLWNDTRSAVAGSSGNWNDSRNTLGANSGLWNDTRGAVAEASGEWDSAYDTLGANSGLWKDAKDTLASSSADWKSTFTTLGESSARWNSTSTSVEANSADWQLTYGTVGVMSASWDGGNSAFTSLGANSGLWNDTRSSVAGTSGNWNSSYESLGTSSGRWDSAYLTMESASSTWSSPPASAVRIDSSTYAKILSAGDDNAQLAFDRLNIHQHNTGAVTTGLVSDNGDGTINITSGYVYMYNLPGWNSDMARYQIPAISGQVLTDQVTNYIYADYNSGSPIYNVTTSTSVINNSDKVFIASIFREGTVLHIIDADWALATATRMNDRSIQMQRFVRTSGLALSETPTRVVNIGSGLVYYGIRYYTTPTVSSSADTCTLYYHSSGNWATSAVPQYINDSYDNGTDVKHLSPTGPNASTWTRTTTTATVTFANHGLRNGDIIQVTVTSDTRSIPLVSYAITKIDEDIFSIVCLDKGDSSGTLSYMISPRYSVNWIYRFVESSKHIAILLGGGNYNITEARNSLPPTPPTVLSRYAILVGRILVENSTSSAFQIDSAFVTTFETMPASDHNDLGGLQGGYDASEMYHLNYADYVYLTELSASEAPLWNDTRTSVGNSSGRWESVFSTVYSNSGTWALSGGSSVDLGDIPASSGNWNSAFNTVGANSAIWDRIDPSLYTIGTSANPEADFICDGTADDVQFAEAIASMSAGDVLRVLPGTYNLATTVAVNKTIAIEGSSKDSCTINVAGDFKGIICTASAVIRNLTFTSVGQSIYTNLFGTNGNSYPVLELSADSCNVINCHFSCYMGIFVHCMYHNISDNTFLCTGAIIISWTDTGSLPALGYIGNPPAYITIENNIFGKGNYCVGAIACLVAVSLLKIANNEFKSYSAIYSDTNRQVEFSTIIGNTFYLGGISGYGGSGGFSNTVITNNILHTSQNFLMATMIDCVFSNNILYGASTNFITLYTGSLRNKFIGNTGKTASGTLPSNGVLEVGTSNYNIFEGNSAFGTITLVGNSSFDYDNRNNSAYGILGTSSGNWNSVFSTVSTASGAWNSGGIAWSTVNADTTATVNYGYVTSHSTTAVNIMLPSVSPLYSRIKICGVGAGGWKIAQPNSGSIVYFGNMNTTLGAGGYLASTNGRDKLELLCTSADSVWDVMSSIGNITVA